MLGARSRRYGRRAGGWVITAPILALLAVLVLAAAGCGGSSDTKANEAYANSVCSAIGNWEQQIKSIATSFIGGVSQASFQASITQAEAATKTLVTQIKAVPPRLLAGASRQAATRSAHDRHQQHSETPRHTYDQVQADIWPPPSARRSRRSPQSRAASETNAAITTLKDAGGSLASAFKSTDSCKSLGGS